MMPFRLFILSLILCSCAPVPVPAASKDDIVAHARQLIAEREGWKERTYIGVVQQSTDGTWRAEAHQLEPASAGCGCILFVPGSNRELQFSASGRLLIYTHT